MLLTIVRARGRKASREGGHNAPPASRLPPTVERRASSVELRSGRRSRRCSTACRRRDRADRLPATGALALQAWGSADLESRSILGEALGPLAELLHETRCCGIVLVELGRALRSPLLPAAGSQLKPSFVSPTSWETPHRATMRHFSASLILATCAVFALRAMPAAAQSADAAAASEPELPRQPEAPSDGADRSEPSVTGRAGAPAPAGTDGVPADAGQGDRAGRGVEAVSAGAAPTASPPLERSATSSPRHSAIPLMIGGAAAVIGTGAFFAFSSMADASEDDIAGFRSRYGAFACGDGTAPAGACAEQRERVEDFDRYRNWSTWSMGFALAGLATVSGYLVYTVYVDSREARGASPSVSLRGGVTPGSADLRLVGTF